MFCILMLNFSKFLEEKTVAKEINKMIDIIAIVKFISTK